MSIVAGQPVEGGEVITEETAFGYGRFLYLIKVSSPLTRKIEVTTRLDPGFWNFRKLFHVGDTIPAEYAGWIASGSIQGSITDEEYENGIWVSFEFDSRNRNSPLLSSEPVTPAEDHRSNRFILIDHAHRLRVEHHPASAVLDDTDVARIEHINYELPEEGRIRSGNVTEKVRGYIGWLWKLNEAFGRMPAGTTEADTAWKAERDRLEELFKPFCEVCEGSGLAVDVFDDHPHAEWQEYLRNGIRWKLGPDYDNPELADTLIMTPEVGKIDRKNYVLARKLFRQKDSLNYDYGDFKSEAMPYPEGVPAVYPWPADDVRAFDKANFGVFWRNEVKKLERAKIANPSLVFSEQIYFQFVAMNLLAYFRDENKSSTRNFMFDIAKQVTAQEVINNTVRWMKISNDFTTVTNELGAVVSPPLFANWWEGFALYLDPDQRLTVNDMVMLRAGEQDSDGNWVDASKRFWHEILNKTLDVTLSTTPSSPMSG